MWNRAIGQGAGGWRASLALAAVLVASGRPSTAQTSSVPPGAGSPQAPSGDEATRIASGRALFSANGCAACHTLSDAGAVGHVGPSLDGDPKLTEELVIERVTNGSGPMPDFGGKLSEADIAALAVYLTHVAKK